MVFGRLRFAALRNALDIDHSAIRVHLFVDAGTWTVDGKGLIRAVVKDGSACDEELVERCIAQLPVADPWRVVRGHDVVSILRIGLRRILGNIGAGVGEEHIASILRAGFTPADLQATALWTDVRDGRPGTGRFGFLRIDYGADGHQARTADLVACRVVVLFGNRPVNSSGAARRSGPAAGGARRTGRRRLLG